MRVNRMKDKLGTFVRKLERMEDSVKHTFSLP